jgi:outer membrane murein-binding lipoprotein Lpp
VRTLLIALLNATLILIALCLWLAWSVVSTARDVAVEVSQTAETVLPLRAEVRDLTAEVAALRTDLQAARDAADTAATARMAALADAMEGMDARMSEIGGALDSLRDQPDTVLAPAISGVFDRLEQIALRVAGCLGT